MELVDCVFTIPSVTAFLSNRVCLDPLENFFGEGGGGDNVKEEG